MHAVQSDSVWSSIALDFMFTIDLHSPKTYGTVHDISIDGHVVSDFLYMTSFLLPIHRELSIDI